MIIENKWIICETYSQNVFIGMNPENQPIFRPIDSGVRTYITARGANIAIARIIEFGYDSTMQTFFIERQEVKDVIPDKFTDKSKVFFEDWEVLMPKFGRVRYLRKADNNAEHLAMTNRSGTLQELGTHNPADSDCSVERQAWRTYIDELYKAGDERIIARHKKKCKKIPVRKGQGKEMRYC